MTICPGAFFFVGFHQSRLGRGKDHLCEASLISTLISSKVADLLCRSLTEGLTLEADDQDRRYSMISLLLVSDFLHQIF